MAFIYINGKQIPLVGNVTIIDWEEILNDL